MVGIKNSLDKVKSCMCFFTIAPLFQSGIINFDAIDDVPVHHVIVNSLIAPFVIDDALMPLQSYAQVQFTTLSLKQFNPFYLYL